MIYKVEPVTSNRNLPTKPGINIESTELIIWVHKEMEELVYIILNLLRELQKQMINIVDTFKTQLKLNNYKED